jgi:signal transduction histidine kinase
MPNSPSATAASLRRLKKILRLQGFRGRRSLAGSPTLRRKEIQLAVIFTSLIIVPCGLLGYFSWRAFENEKLLSQERLRESYVQFARLAAREIDHELEDVERQWTTAVKNILQKGQPNMSAGEAERYFEDEPLIAACFLLTAPGQSVIPPGMSMEEDNATPNAWEPQSYLREFEVYKQLQEQGEELEYHAYELEGAVARYREILLRVSSRQLRAMAVSHIGRVLQKKGEWTAALDSFHNLLAGYAEERDLHKMYLRFLAQYQIAVCLDNLERDQEALATLARLNLDLFERSDAINTLQYSYFFGMIQDLASRLLASPHLSSQVDYKVQFQALAEQNKKRIGQKYFLQLLDQQLNESIIKRKRHKLKFRYLAGEADGEPFLLAYQSLPDPSGIFTAGVLGLQIDLARLRQKLIPAILRNLKFNRQVNLGLLNEKGEYVLGPAAPEHALVAAQRLERPFDFWQVAIYLEGATGFSQRQGFSEALSFWLISLLLLSILFGACLFILRAQREARLSGIKSSFVSNVSHELRTPLASIKMLAELMEMQLNGESTIPLERSKARHYLGIIQRECNRLGRLLENVLDFSKIERGFKQFNFEYEDPGVVLQRAVETFRPHAESQGFALEVEIAEDLPAVRIDADSIAQVLLNLLSNALKYSDEVKKISVRACREDVSHIMVEVIDRGIGIEAAEIPKIFEAFYRIDPRLSSRKQGGVGLGLTLVRHIVQAHGGEVRLSSAIGKGSTFGFTLPIPSLDLNRPSHREVVNVPASAAAEVFEGA